MKRMLSSQIVKDYILIMIGTTILACGLSMFYDPLNMVVGGVTGFAIALKEITGMPIYITNLVINVPLFVLAIIFKGKDYGGKSLFATLYLSLALFFTRYLPVATDELLLGSIFGAVFSGVGLGLVFYAKATTGGTDLGAALLQMIFKHHSIARIMLVLDACVIGFGFFVFGPENSMYAIISVYLAAKIIDAILEGVNFSKAAFIISDKEQEISDAIFKSLDRGITSIYGAGKYTQEEKTILLCVVSKKEIVTIKEIVKEVDRGAFVIVADVREVLGEGFIEYHNV